MHFPKTHSIWWAAGFSLLLLLGDWCSLCPERSWPIHRQAPAVAAPQEFSCLESSGQPPGLLHTLLRKHCYWALGSRWESHFGLGILQQLFSAGPCSPPEGEATSSNPVTADNKEPSHLWESPSFSPAKLFIWSCINSFWKLLQAPSCPSVAEIRIGPLMCCLSSASHPEERERNSSDLGKSAEASLCHHNSLPLSLTFPAVASVLCIMTSSPSLFWTLVYHLWSHLPPQQPTSGHYLSWPFIPWPWPVSFLSLLALLPQCHCWGEL